MNKPQFENVINLSAKDRYVHFIGKVADWEELWSLENSNGFVSYADDKGRPGIPFWPHPEFAQAIAIGELSDYHPEKIELSVFMERWLPGMNGDGLSVVVFPTPEGKGLFIEPNELLRH